MRGDQLRRARVHPFTRLQAEPSPHPNGATQYAGKGQAFALRAVSARHTVFGAVLAAVALILATFSLALAHAQLVATEPREGEVLQRGPERIRLEFNEPIEPEFFSLEVYAADRSRVDRRDARRAPSDPSVVMATVGELGPGTYTVVWRALSIDGHPVRGVFAFTVGADAAPGNALRFDLDANPTGNLGALVRWLTFFAAFALVGGFAFFPLVLWPAHRSAGLEGLAAAQRGARRFTAVAWISIAALFLLNLLALVVQAADVTGVPLAEVFDGRAITRLLTGTKYGALWLARMGMLLILLAIAVLLAVEARPRPILRWLGVATGGAFLATLSASGHASAVPTRTGLAMAVDWVHFMAGAIWVGGLLQLLLALPVALQTVDASGRRTLLARVVRRFSLVAGTCVAILVLTGLYTSLLHVPSWLALLDTRYGAALSGKLLLILPLLLIAAVNLLVMHPRFARAAATRSGVTEDRLGRRVFLGLVGSEVLLVAAVLAVTGSLTGLPPASSELAEGRPFAETARVGDLTLGLEIAPNQAGTNQVVVSVLGPTGQPLVGVQRVELAMSHLEMSMGTREAVAQPQGDGRYLLSGNLLSMTGRWQVEVRVRRAEGEATARFTPVVSPPPGTNRPAFSPARVVLLAVTDPTRERALSINSQFVAALLCGAAATVLFARSLSRRRQATAVAASALLAIALGIGGATVADAYRRSLPNPVPADTASLTRGQAVYTEQCALCHGDEGRGDGPAGFALRPRPADFRVHMAAGHTDAELFYWITRGVDGTSMPGFGDRLTEQQRWDVINYIRTFAAQR